MLKILIVDDEEIIRDGIALKIERLFPEARVVGKAEDSEQAFSLVETEHPNLIITDIRMPEMDGLQFIEQLKAKYNDLKFILISGYQEFEYARKAIDLNVEGYLLKPIDNQQLKSVIEKAVRKIEAELSEDSYLQELKVKAKNYIYHLKNKYLTDAIHLNNEFDIAYIINALGQMDIKFRYPNFCVISIIFDDQSQGNDLTKVKNTLVDLAEQSMAKIGMAVAFENLKKENQIVAVLNYEDLSRGSSGLISLGNEFLNAARASLKLNLSIGIGRDYQSINFLHRSYNESYTAAIQKVVLGENRIIQIQDIPNSNQVTFFIPEAERQLLLSYINSKNRVNAVEIINKIFGMIKEQGLSYNTVKTLCMDMSIMLGKLVKDAGSNLENIFHEDIFSEDYLSKYTTLEALKVWLIEVVSSICNYLTDLTKSDGKKIIGEIREYISNYYYVDINLNELSKKYYINPSYLSQLFKNETGEKFVDYHIRVRIEKAKELLANTSLTSYKIAEMVGYNNSRYFSEIFAKYVGTTPSKFRESQGT